jgi:hypothetical protein
VQDDQMKIQTTLINRIKEKRAIGEDTSRLEGALEDLGFDISAFGNNAERILNPNQLTGKQVIGDALQLATTAGGAKVAGAIAGKATGATGVLKGALQGAKTGAISGTALGGATGVSQGLQEDMNAGDIVKQGLKGAGIGLATGGILGGLVGGVSGGVKSSQLNKKQEYLKNITPNTNELTPTEYKKLVRQGKIIEKTATTPDEYILSPREIETAEKYKGLITKDPVKNVNNFMNKIAEQDDNVRVYLEKNNNKFNENDLRNFLKNKLDDIDDLTIPEERLQKAKGNIIEGFLKGIKNKDNISLWQARKDFDRQIQKAFSGSPTLQKEMSKTLRNSIQDFISGNTDDVTYKAFMKDMSSLYDLVEVAERKAVKGRGQNAIQTWIKQNPNKSSLAKWLLGAGAGAVAYDLLVK